MTNVVRLTIPAKRQDDLAELLRRLERQNRNAARRLELSRIAEALEIQIARLQAGRANALRLIEQLDSGGPNDAA